MPIVNVQLRGVVKDAHGNDRELPSNQALAQRGPVVTVSLRPIEEQRQVMAERGEPIPAAIDGLAMIDTGASVTCVDEAAAGRAGLHVVDRGTISSASHSAHSVPVFACDINVAGLGRIRLPRAMGATLENHGLLAIIGRDALGSTVFIYNGPSGSFSIAH